MAPINTRIVRRTVGLLEERSLEERGGGGAASPFAADFRYAECLLAPGEEVATKLARAAAAPAAKRRELVEKGRLPKPGEGPSADERAKAWFKFMLLAEAAPGQRLLGSVSGGDPGYEETAKMVAETALLLATKRDALPATGGFHTPASAGGALLTERLHREGIAFEELDASVLPAPPPPAGAPPASKL